MFNCYLLEPTQLNTLSLYLTNNYNVSFKLIMLIYNNFNNYVMKKLFD